MKTTLFRFAFLAVFIFALQSYAEIWHTPSGKSYDVYVTARNIGKKGEKGKKEEKGLFYYLTYRTTRDLSDKKALETEFGDILAHFYYLRLPEKTRNDKNSIVAVEAFREFPTSQKERKPSSRHAKKLSELQTAVKNHFDENRLKAFQHVKQNHYKNAVSSFNAIKAKVSRDYFGAANINLRLGDKTAAVGQLEAGLKQYPNDPTLLNNLAMTTMLDPDALSKGSFRYNPLFKEKALAVLDKAEKVDKSWVTQYNRGFLEQTTGNLKEAAKRYEKALKQSHESPMLHYRLANFYHTQKEFGKAKKHYGKAIQKLKKNRSPASERRIQFLENLLKLAKEKKAP